MMCHSCRGLIEPSTRTCPLCGLESVPAPRAGSVEKAGSEQFFSRLVMTINIALFVLMVLADLKSGTGSIMKPSMEVFYDFGGRSVQAISNGQWWLLVTPNFLHLGIIHLLFNSFALYQIGPQVEEVYGSQKFIFLYVAIGILSNVSSYSFNINGAGASGAIFGLIGLMAVYGYRMGGAMGRALMRQMIIWAAFGVVVTLTYADQAGHIGGFISGAALGFIIKAEPPVTARASLYWNITAIVCALVVAVSFVMVALNYGTRHTALEVLELDKSVRQLSQAFHDSLNMADPSSERKTKAAREMRNAAGDIGRLDRIDDTSDAIRARLVELANRRAEWLDRAEASPLLPGDPVQADARDLEKAIKDYHNWLDSVMSRYGLEYVEQR